VAHPNWIPLPILSAEPSVLADWRAQWTGSAALLRGWAFPALVNLLVCLPIGALLTPHVVRLRSTVLSGFLLSLSVESTQLTGTWGLYPCAYRKFDVDDLILNTLGVALGFVLVRRWRGRTVAGPRQE
jgi:glycopeptide antibiotics resistance protein